MSARVPPRLWVLLAAFVAAVLLTAQGRALAQQGPFLTARHVVQLPADDPRAGAWDQAPASEVPLIPQGAVMPALRQTSVSKVTVRALHDGKDLAVLLEWQDATRDATTGHPDLFRDAAAIMLPVSEGIPNICMGAAGQIANLWHWKADWQEDIDKGFQDVVDAYPNFYKDFYPFASGQPPFRFPQDFAAAEAKNYSPGLAAGNPLSQPVKTSPVEELTSQGFGTATHKSLQQVNGKGEWANGTWRVVFSRSLKTADPEAPDLAARKDLPLAFAVWNGSNQEVGARKQLSSFLTLAIEEAPAGQTASALWSSETPLWMWGGLGVAFLAVLGGMWMALRRTPSAGA
ncbi:MAG: nitrate reductase [Chloroflexi bacterium]|nr:nitrate reductase [Chloroflexota bacterium]